jgi:hypothetical protein
MGIQRRIKKMNIECFLLSCLKYHPTFHIGILGILYARCSFTVQKFKASTARVVMWKEFELPSVYTLESSFLGPLTVWFQ